MVKPTIITNILIY